MIQTRILNPKAADVQNFDLQSRTSFKGYQQAALSKANGLNLSANKFKMDTVSFGKDRIQKIKDRANEIKEDADNVFKTANEIWERSSLLLKNKGKQGRIQVAILSINENGKRIMSEYDTDNEALTLLRTSELNDDGIVAINDFTEEKPARYEFDDSGRLERYLRGYEKTFCKDKKTGEEYSTEKAKEIFLFDGNNFKYGKGFELSPEKNTLSELYLFKNGRLEGYIKGASKDPNTGRMIMKNSFKFKKNGDVAEDRMTKTDERRIKSGYQDNPDYELLACSKFTDAAFYRDIKKGTIIYVPSSNPLMRAVDKITGYERRTMAELLDESYYGFNYDAAFDGDYYGYNSAFFDDDCGCDSNYGCDPFRKRFFDGTPHSSGFSHFDY